MPIKSETEYFSLYSNVAKMPVLFFKSTVANLDQLQSNQEILLSDFGETVYTAFQVDLSQRFLNQYPSNCIILYYSIAFVIEKESGDEIDFNNLFQIDNQTGIFEVLRFNEAYENYMVYVQVSNGLV